MAPPKETFVLGCLLMSNCCKPKRKDWFFRIVGGLVVLFYAIGQLQLNFFSIFPDSDDFKAFLPSPIHHFSHSVMDLVHSMIFGVVLGLIVIGLLSFVPRDVVRKVMGPGDSFSGILRATVAGLFLDLCSHGILMVGIKLYERGVSLAQVMAFLIASPWNSLSLTIILASMVGIPITITFVLLSVMIAIVTGGIIRYLVLKKLLPSNPNTESLSEGVSIRSELRSAFSGKWTQLSFYRDVIRHGLVEGKMVIRWLCFGIILASLLRSVLTPDQFITYLGPSLAGLGLTLLLATVIEVCSEGSVPIAADLVTLSKAPGNSFSFLMAGVSTDYTEIMSLRDVTGSWACSLILPLLTLPQIVALGILLNNTVAL